MTQQHTENERVKRVTDTVQSLKERGIIVTKGYGLRSPYAKRVTAGRPNGQRGVRLKCR